MQRFRQMYYVNEKVNLDIYGKHFLSIRKRYRTRSINYCSS